jgi:NTE family protein
MNVQFHAQSRTAKRRLPFECVALVLQGGGALGPMRCSGLAIWRASARSISPWTEGSSGEERELAGVPKWKR